MVVWWLRYLIIVRRHQNSELVIELLIELARLAWPGIEDHLQQRRATDSDVIALIWKVCARIFIRRHQLFD